MNWSELQKVSRITPIFSLADVIKWFPKESENQALVQLARFVNANLLSQPRKGIYILAESKIDDPFLLVSSLRSPSYISLETALNYYSLIPDIPSAITVVTTKKTKTYETSFGKFIYRSIKPELFFGFVYIEGKNANNLGYQIAVPEKALLDYLMLNQQIDDLSEIRLSTTDNLSVDTLAQFSLFYNKRVQKLVEKLR